MFGLLDWTGRYSIKQKLMTAIGVILLVLVITVATTLSSLTETRQKITVVVDEIQPTLMASMELKSYLLEASTSMGFYLLSKEQQHKSDYRHHLEQTKIALQNLKAMPGFKNSSESGSVLDEIEVNLEKFFSYESQLLSVAEDTGKNFIALRYSGEELNPYSQTILQTLSSMLLSESEEEASVKRKALFSTIHELRYTWATVMNNLRMYIFLGSADAQSNMELYLSDANIKLEKVEKFKDLLTFEQEEGIQTLRNSIDSFTTGISTLIELHNGERARMDAYLIRAEIGPLIASADKNIQILIGLQRQYVQSTSQGLVEHVDTTNARVNGLLVLGLFVGLFMLWLINYVICGPMRLAATAMNDIANGDGDLTQRLNSQGEDELALLANGFNIFAGEVQNLIKKVSSSTVQLSSAASNMTELPLDASHNIDLQKSATDQIASAITEMSANIQQVADNAEVTATAAKKANADTKNGRTIISGALDAITELSGETQSSVVSIETLGGNIKEITTVIDVIRGVAEQTNLLALNAAIEAARAGEQGRGFAVVADEVRALADRTTKSTVDIQSRVESLQKEAESVVSSMASNKKSADTSIELATNAAAILGEITQSVDNIAEMSHQIASAADQQSVVSSEVLENISTITLLSDKTHESAKLVATSTSGLNELSDSLTTMTARYKV